MAVDPLLEYNALATQTAYYNIPVVDTYNAAKVLEDLTYDGGHYNGIVGWNIANLVQCDLRVE